MATESEIKARIIRRNDGYVNTQTVLKASGNLSYLDFIRVVEKIWAYGHPDIPLYGMTPSRLPRYPAIIYSLDARTPVQNESKPRIREIPRTDPSEPGVIVKGQRFNNIVRFTAVAEADKNGTQIVEELIEAFEEEMQRYTPIFKKLGLSEFVYSRRLADSEINRPGEDIVVRAVTYRVTTERITRIQEDKLTEVYVSLRTYSETNYPATPDYETVVVGTISSDIVDDNQTT